MAFKTVDVNNIKDFKNFKLSEIKCKCGGKYCNGYPVGFSYELLEQLQKVRNHFKKPVIITSAIRCTKHNANVGGIKNSKHTQGKAVDFYVKGVSYKKLYAYIKTLPHNNYTYNISGSVMHHDIKPSEVVKKYNLTRVLKKGCKGADVKYLQLTLINLGYDLGKYKDDGIFGNDTAKAVGKYQKDKKLKLIDDVVGKETAHSLGWLYKGK